MSAENGFKLGARLLFIVVHSFCFTDFPTVCKKSEWLGWFMRLPGGSPITIVSLQFEF